MEPPSLRNCPGQHGTGSLTVLPEPVLCQQITQCALTLNLVKLLFYIKTYTATSLFRVRWDSFMTPALHEADEAQHDPDTFSISSWPS